MFLVSRQTHFTQLVPENNSASIITGGTESRIFRAVAKVQNGDNDSIFRVILHEGKNSSSNILIQGEDREPCNQILTSE